MQHQRWKKAILFGIRIRNDAKLFDQLDFIVDDTFICMQGGIFKHQVIGLPMGTNSAQERADLTTYFDKQNFIFELLKNNKKQEAKKHSNDF